MTFVPLVHICDLETSGLDPFANGIHEICSLFLGHEKVRGRDIAYDEHFWWETIRSQLIKLVKGGREEHAAWKSRIGDVGGAMAASFPAPEWESSPETSHSPVWERTFRVPFLKGEEERSVVGRVIRMRFSGTAYGEDHDPEAYRVNGFNEEDLAHLDTLRDAIDNMRDYIREMNLSLRKDIILAPELPLAYRVCEAGGICKEERTLANWLRWTHQASVYVGQNTPFDIAFLQEAYRQGNYGASEEEALPFPFIVPNPFRKTVFDTKMTRALLHPGKHTSLRSSGLNSSNEETQGLAREKAHDALVDVLLVVDAICQDKTIQRAIGDVAFAQKT